MSSLCPCRSAVPFLQAALALNEPDDMDFVSELFCLQAPVRLGQWEETTGALGGKVRPQYSLSKLPPCGVAADWLSTSTEGPSSAQPVFPTALSFPPPFSPPGLGGGDSAPSVLTMGSVLFLMVVQPPSLTFLSSPLLNHLQITQVELHCLLSSKTQLIQPSSSNRPIMSCTFIVSVWGSPQGG